MRIELKKWADITPQDILKEQRIVAPNRDELLDHYGSFQIKPFVQFLTAQELMDITDASTIWVPGGNHDWRLSKSNIASRIYAAELTHFCRSTGETECTHPMGAADLTANYMRVFNYPPRVLTFVQVNHDRSENNHHLGVTPRKICFMAWRGDKEERKLALTLLTWITDTQGLSNKDKDREQISRANKEKTGHLAELRFDEKGASGLSDSFNIHYGIMPFGNLGKYARYIFRRIDIAQAINDRGWAGLRDKKLMYIDLCESNLKRAIKLDGLQKVWPPRDFNVPLLAAA